MPISFYIKIKYKLIVFVHSGEIPDYEFFSFYQDLYENNAMDPSLNMLVDLRETDSTPRNPDVLLMLANFIKSRFEGLATSPKVAVVAPKDISFGLARMFEVFSDTAPLNFIVFRAMDAALAWLGLPEDLINNHVRDTQQSGGDERS